MSTPREQEIIQETIDDYVVNGMSPKLLEAFRDKLWKIWEEQQDENGEFQNDAAGVGMT